MKCEKITLSAEFKNGITEEAVALFQSDLVSLRLIGKKTTNSIIYDEDLKMHLLNKRVNPDVSLKPFRFNTPKTNYILDSTNSFTLW